MATRAAYFSNKLLKRYTSISAARRYLYCERCRSLQAAETTLKKSDHDEVQVHDFDQQSDITIQHFKSPPLIDHKLLVSYMLDKSDPTIDPGSIYDKYPNAHRTLKGKTKERVNRSVWREQDCSEAFPSSPEEANLDLVQYMEQRDIWQRRQVIHIPDFCVGSIVAVTRADRFAPEGWTRFVGLCIFKNNEENMKSSRFILRNVIQGEPLEIQYPTYHPLIQKLEVLRHERWENEEKFEGLKFLRDYPTDYSYVDETMQAEEYTEQPKIRKWTAEDEEKCKSWFEAVYESRRRR